MARRRLDLATTVSLLRAAGELALARLRLQSFDPRALTVVGVAELDEAQIDRVAFAVRAMGARVPWRSDCLVQALAGQHWLAKLGVGSSIQLGVKPSQAPIDAHAWLKVGERIVLGGDVSGYEPFKPARQFRTPH